MKVNLIALAALSLAGVGCGLLYLAVDALSHINTRLAELGRLLEGQHKERESSKRWRARVVGEEEERPPNG